MGPPVNKPPTLWSVRSAKPKESGVLTQIAFEAKAHWGYPAHWMEHWRPSWTITPEFLESHPTWVAEQNGTILAFASLTPFGRRARLEHLWVRPQCHRRGLGKALFQTVVRAAADRGWATLEIESDPNAEAFYRHMGAQRIGQNETAIEGHSRALPVLEFLIPAQSQLGSPPQTEILLATLNAKYIHAAFGLRYLLANLGELKPRATIAEFDINQKTTEIAEAILARNPRLLGLGVYIWNVALTTELVAVLKKIRPELIIILGGPEVSYETEGQEIVRLADHVITGEADLKFAECCRSLLNPLSNADNPLPKVLHAAPPDLVQVELPYELYSDQDAAHRVIYVEASRGCPFTCEFCLSSLDIPVRQFPLDRFLTAMQSLLDRGVQQFKFVDRTFNLHLPTSRAILKFFLDRWRPGLFIHFEMVPDRLPEALREWIAKFPPGTLQFEVGIQTFNPAVETLISRRQNHTHLQANFQWLRSSSGVHVHADLIAGLPGESLESFAAGFDQLIALDPQEIQVGLLKRLRGTPICRHDQEWAMVYNPHPPYEVLQTRLLDFATLATLRRFARFWDLFGNSGNFVEASRLLLGTIPPASAEIQSPKRSAFWCFWDFCQWLHGRGAKTSGIALLRQFEWVFEYLTTVLHLPKETARSLLQSDYQRAGRTDLPSWLGNRASQGAQKSTSETPTGLPRRQARHVAVPTPSDSKSGRVE